MTTTFHNLIGGDWVEGPGTIDNVNPSDLSDVIGQYAQADQVQLDRAVAAARAALPACREMPLEARPTALDAIGREMMDRAGELGTLLSREEGKPLAEGIFTRSLARSTHFRRNVETGCVTVNLPTAGTDYHVPFGGRKNSSSGPREQGRGAVEFYTQQKTAYIRAGDPA